MNGEVRSKREEAIEIMKLANKLRNFSIEQNENKIEITFWDERTDTYVIVKSDNDWLIFSSIMIEANGWFLVKWADREGNTIEEFITDKIILL